MKKNQIRIPKQQRSVEKKERIINAGLQLFCEKGYYNTNTAEIAKKAGVSTGLVYSYFKNKDDIFAAGIKQLSASLQAVISDAIGRLDFSLLTESDTALNDSLYYIVKEIIDYSVSMHIRFRNTHQELCIMENNPFIFEFLMEFETQTAELIKGLFQKSGFKLKNPNEKIHLLFHLVEDYCHETVFHQHEYINYDAYLNETIQTIIFILKS